MRIQWAASGRPSRPSGHVFRGSRKRLRRIRARDNWSIELVIFLIFMLFVLMILVPWMATHPHTHP